jgi:hypothetical protein
MGFLDDILSGANGGQWGPWNSLYPASASDPTLTNAPQDAAGGMRGDAAALPSPGTVPMPQPRPATAPPSSSTALAPPDRYMAIGNYQMPVYDGALSQSDGTSASVPSSASPQVSSDAAPDLGDRLSAGLTSLANSRGLIPSLANGIQGFASGQRADPAGVANNLTLRALQARGVSPVDAQAAIGNPAILRALINQYYGAAAPAPGSRGQAAPLPSRSDAAAPDPTAAPPAATPAAVVAPNPFTAPRPILRPPIPRGVTRNGIRWSIG